MTCTVEGCDSPVHGKGWCNLHYRRWRYNGSTYRAPRIPKPPRQPGKPRTDMTAWVEDIEWLIRMGECPAGLVAWSRIPMGTIIRRLERAGRQDLATPLYSYDPSRRLSA